MVDPNESTKAFRVVVEYDRTRIHTLVAHTHSRIIAVYGKHTEQLCTINAQASGSLVTICWSISYYKCRK